MALPDQDDRTGTEVLLNWVYFRIRPWHVASEKGSVRTAALPTAVVFLPYCLLLVVHRWSPALCDVCN